MENGIVMTNYVSTWWYWSPE